MLSFPFQRPPPRIPSQETINKWAKGAVDPETLTFEDRQKLLGRQPYEASNAFCKLHTGLDFDALVQKAARTDDLTYLESWLVLYGTVSEMENADNEMMDAMRWPEDVHKKYKLALEAILTETDKQARKNARVAMSRHSDARQDLEEKISNDDRKNIQWANRFPWVVDLENQPDPSWGFVCIRTSFRDDAAWKHFQEQFNAAVDLSLSFVHNSEDRYWTPNRLKQRWKIQWVEDLSLDNAVLDDLCVYFRRFRDEGKVDPGLRQDAFLYADEAAIQSSLDHCPLPERGFVMAADASYDSSKLPTYLYNFQGNVRVALTAVFTTFYARLIPRGDPEDDPTITRGMRQSWDVIYYKARRNKIDKSYPPASQLNRA